MLQTQTVEAATLDILKRLQQIPELKLTRLVGGTALALHFGHRLSIDIDLFGEIEHEDITLLLNNADFDSFLVDRNFKNIKHYRINNVKVDIVNYTYKWIEPCVEIDEMRIAGLKDIAAMKLNAITGRGSKKDFIDLFFLMNIFSLKEMLDFYAEKYPNNSFFMVAKSLTYFADAELQQMPMMLQEASWDEIKKRICLEVEKL